MLVYLDIWAAYIGDIFVSGNNEEDHDANLLEILERIEQYGIKLKIKKYKFLVPEMAYWE